MASQAAIAERHGLALAELGEILERRDPEVGERVRKANHDGGIPSPTRRPLETAAYHAECMASLARIVDAQLTTRPRGRPRKAS